MISKNYDAAGDEWRIYNYGHWVDPETDEVLESSVKYVNIFLLESSILTGSENMMIILFLVYWRNCNENPFALKLKFSNYL